MGCRCASGVLRKCPSFFFSEVSCLVCNGTFSLFSILTFEHVPGFAAMCFKTLLCSVEMFLETALCCLDCSEHGHNSRRWAAPCESQTASSPTCNGNGNGDGKGDETATAKSTAAPVSGHTAQSNGHHVNNGMDTHRHLWTHTHTQTRSSGNTHARTLEHTRTPVKPRLGAGTSPRCAPFRPSCPKHSLFPHWVKIEKTRFLSFSGPNQNPKNKVLDISRTKLPAVIMSYAKPQAAVGTMMTSGHARQVPARLPPLITTKESTGIIHLLVGLPESFEM